jgi:hypothetical protein
MEPLVIEERGVLPDLPNVILGIVAREDFDILGLAPVITAFEAIMTS